MCGKTKSTDTLDRRKDDKTATRNYPVRWIGTVTSGGTLEIQANLNIDDATFTL